MFYNLPASPRSLTGFAIRRRALRALLYATATLALQAGDESAVPVRDFGDLSLEELMNETVTSVSKKEQKRADAAAAVTVLSNDDIRRSGVTTLADALRLVPGMTVGSVNSHSWSVSARGFNNLYANKLLVLVDGRAVYSPVFAGAVWDTEQGFLEDVDRIEVIRGPGATVWGANAVNGVVNIVTRSARDTQGGLVYASAGDLHETDNGVRYGGRLGEKTYYRVFARFFSDDDFPLADGRPAGDGWRGEHGGFRVDHHPDDHTQLTWQADATKVDMDNGLVDGRNLNTLGRLTRSWGDRSSLEVQAYYDHSFRENSSATQVQTDTVDFTAQHTFGLGERNDVIWGAGFRFTDIGLRPTSPLVEVRDEDLDTRLFSVFLQDEFRLIPDKVTLTAGAKFEHNDYTGVEIQPSARGVFKPTANQTLWGAVSRAVRTPAAIEGKDVFAVTTGAPVAGPGGLYVPRAVGNPDVSSEVLWAYELGYRIQPTRRISVDLAVFYHDYSDLIASGDTVRFVPGAPVGTLEIPFGNKLHGHTYGGELSVTVSPAESWRLTAGYSLLRAEIRGPAGTDPEAIERGSPRNQATLRSSHELTKRLSVDAQLRYVDAIRFVPAYITADLRIACRVNDRLELSLVGQNLLDDRHPEQGPAFFAVAAEVPRSFYGKLVWRF